MVVSHDVSGIWMRATHSLPRLAQEQLLPDSAATDAGARALQVYPHSSAGRENGQGSTESCLRLWRAPERLPRFEADDSLGVRRDGDFITLVK